ncbi:MAG: DUF5686 and carboxypeptidase regulatory-like domain-containing protein [Flavobacterium sp.]
MKTIYFVILLCCTASFAQVTGRITSADGQPIPYASIVLSGTYNGTSSNENGNYSLPLKEKGSYTIIFQSLGFKSKEVKTSISSFPHVVNVTLQDEEFTLAEVTVSNTDNPANAVIRQAIAHRKENSEKTAKFEADFYSRGIFRVKDAPRKILGQDLGDFNGALDSTGTGVLYLSETVSRVKYQKPGKIKETIVASKVAGDDNGFSFNNAAAAEFDFYENYIPFDINVVSPIADNAFSYYKYSLESTFFDQENHLINKIKVTPKQEADPVTTGYIYIVEDTWEIYAVDLSITGKQVKMDILDTLTIQQAFGYNPAAKIWTKNTQSLDFKAGIFGIKFSGRFTYVYSNFVFEPQFDKKTFNNEVLTVNEDANKKENTFWDAIRPIPLTVEESEDYTKKDSIKELRASKVYLDSTDRVNNKFRWLNPVTGYTYTNSYENWSLNYSGIIRGLGFNTVQAYHLAPSFYFTKRNPEKRTYTTIGTNLNYGFAEQRFRATGTISRKFSNFTQRTLTLSGGSSIEQYNPERPINRIVNSISTLFFRENYMKLYNKEFIRLDYSEEVVNGLYVFAGGEYSRRHHLRNNTNFSTLKDAHKPYTSNNPMLPYDYFTPTFETHNIFKAYVQTRITFGQKYWTRPDGKLNLPNDKYPRLYLRYDKGFASSISEYNFDHLSGRLTYDVTLGNKGEMGMNFRGGKFFGSDNIAFTDYRHFNGNQTHIGKSERYLNVFNFLPYYSHSTNDQYFEGHMEHNFKGWLTNNIPLFNKLNYHLVVGAHMLTVPERKPYMEFTAGLDNLGWGKFRFLRVDYIRSYESGFISDGVIFGLTFLDILE